MRAFAMKMLLLTLILCIGIFPAYASGTDVVKINNTWTYTVNGTPDYTYTGFAKNAKGTWYVENGKVTFDTCSVIKDKTGALGTKGTWYYVVWDKVQTSFTGLANYKNENGWWYIKNGKVDFSYTGIASNVNGTWYVANGKVDFSANGTYKSGSTTYTITNGKAEKTSTSGNTSGSTSSSTSSGNTSGNTSSSTNSGSTGGSSSSSSSGTNSSSSSSSTSSGSSSGSTSSSTGNSTNSNSHVHSYTEEITKEATCEEYGLKTYTCSCGDSYTRTIYPTKHDYVAKTTKSATSTANGLMTYTCSKCGDSYTKIIPATASCKLSDTLLNGTYYYYVNSENADVYTVAENKSGMWAVRGGKVDMSYTGLAANEDGVWYVKNGKVETVSGTKTVSGVTYKVTNGKVTITASSLATGGSLSAEVNEHICNVPANVIAAFVKDGGTISVVDEYSWEGYTFGSALGLCLGHDIEIANVDLAPAWATEHEFGHFIDWYASGKTGKISTTSEFEDIYALEIGSFAKEYDSTETSNSIEQNGISEYFADAFKQYCKNPEKLKEACPGTYLYIQEIVNYV